MPILRIDVLRKLFVQPVGQARAPGRREALRILRIDVLRELFVQSVGEARALEQRNVKTTGFVVPG